ncbi:hypothetical protein KEM52_003048 [Ascosphaera acerosa]|nr:hypothetical protein KEM52_003048 [Ascosphaera acerosa]
MATDLNSVAATIMRLLPHIMSYGIPVFVSVTNIWLAYLTMISTAVTILGNHVKRFITMVERTARTAVSELVEQVCGFLMRLGQPTSTVTYIGALVNSMITNLSVYMKMAVNRIVDLCTGFLARVIMRVKSLVDPLANRKPGLSREKPYTPRRPKMDDSGDNTLPDQDDSIGIKPVVSDNHTD